MKDEFHYYQQGYNICGGEDGKDIAEFDICEKASFSLNLFKYNCCTFEKKKKYIQNMIDKCASLGGGRVVIPEGTWVSGPIHMQSNIELHLCNHAVISFSDLPEDYLPVVFTYAKDCENVSITGNQSENSSKSLLEIEKSRIPIKKFMKKPTRN